MENYEQNGKSMEINYKEITPKKYGRGIAVTWLISVVVAIILGLLTYLFIKNPEYVADGNYNVLSTESLIKIIVCPLCILFAFFICSLITARIRIARTDYIKRYVARVKAERLKQQERLRRQQAEPIVLPEQEEMEDDDDAESRRVFFEQSELKDVEDMFIEYCKRNGLILSAGVVSEIFSAIACSRIILVKGAEKAVSNKIAELVVGFFMGNSFSDIIDQNGDSLKTGKEFFEWLRACKRHSRLHFANIECNNFDVILEKYSDFLPTIASPERFDDYESLEKYGCNEKFVFPQSVWCFVWVGNVAIIPKQLAKLGVVLNFAKTELDSKEQPEFCGQLATLSITANDELPTSFMRFSGMMNEEVNLRSLSLETWKKLDHVDSYLLTVGEEFFENKVCRQIERYVAFEMCGGLTEMQALDKVLANKILPFAVAIPKDKWEENQERIPEFLDRIFALQNLPLCEIYLTEVSTAEELSALKTDANNQSAQTTVQGEAENTTEINNG